MPTITVVYTAKFHQEVNWPCENLHELNHETLTTKLEPEQAHLIGDFKIVDTHIADQNPTAEITVGDSFELDGKAYYCQELASHYWYCFAVPLNNPGPPSWFTRDIMANATKL